MTLIKRLSYIKVKRMNLTLSGAQQWDIVSCWWWKYNVSENIYSKLLLLGLIIFNFPRVFFAQFGSLDRLLEVEGCDYDIVIVIKRSNTLSRSLFKYNRSMEALH